MAIQFSAPGLMLIALPFVPESPWHLVRMSKFGQAKKALDRIYWLSGDDTEQHLERIKQVVSLEAKHEGIDTCSYLDLFRGINRIRTFIVGMTFICQEFVGVQFVLGFSTYFFQVRGATRLHPFTVRVHRNRR
jgi:SP family general alpha glucoside:H+ symporter-like MFS transporter